MVGFLGIHWLMTSVRQFYSGAQSSTEELRWAFQERVPSVSRKWSGVGSGKRMGQETILMKYLPLTVESGNPQEEYVLIFNNPGEKDKYEPTPVFTNTFMLLS